MSYDFRNERRCIEYIEHLKFIEGELSEEVENAILHAWSQACSFKETELKPYVDLVGELSIVSKKRGAYLGMHGCNEVYDVGNYSEHDIAPLIDRASTLINDD